MKTMAQVVLENLIDSGVTLYPIGRKAANWEWISCEEAIAELEALQHRSCCGCKYETQGRYRVPCDVCARTLHDEYTSKEQ